MGSGDREKRANRDGLFSREGTEMGKRTKSESGKSIECRDEGNEMLRAVWGRLPGNPGCKQKCLQWDRKLTAHGNKLSG